MPLPPSLPRELIHRRTIICEAFKRQDGRWDIEGHLVDVKTYSFANRDRGTINAGEPIHEMWLRLVVDKDYAIHDAEAVTDYGPFNLCGQIAPDYRKLIGEKIVPGFTARCRTLFGGVQGCTHITELLGRMANATFQAIAPIVSRETAPTGTPKSKPRILDTCHALASDGPVVRREFPDFYTGSRKQ